MGVEYLEPIVYERVFDRLGRAVGWRVPDHERARWENPARFPAPRQPGATPRPLAQLVVELEAWVDLDPFLERQLAATYELEPLRTSRAVASVTAGAESGRLTSPAGLLVKRLREIASGATLGD